MDSTLSEALRKVDGPSPVGVEVLLKAGRFPSFLYFECQNCNDK